jgi:hypothetical protein
LFAPRRDRHQTIRLNVAGVAPRFVTAKASSFLSIFSLVADGPKPRRRAARKGRLSWRPRHSRHARAPLPWSVDEADSKLDRRCFIVRDHNRQALAYVYFEGELEHRSAAHFLTRDEARRSAANIVKLPEAAAAWRMPKAPKRRLSPPGVFPGQMCSVTKPPELVA